MLPIQRTELNRKCDMLLAYQFAFVEIGDRPRDFKYAVVAACRKPELFICGLEYFAAAVVEYAILAYMLRQQKLLVRYYH